MKIITIILLWVLYRIISATLKKQKAKARAMYNKQLAMEREQTRQRKESERIAREQERQAAQLKKHEQRIADLEFRMSQAEADINHWTQQIQNLYALLDIEYKNQYEAAPGSKADITSQKRIITLNNQIHTAETKLSKARHVKATAKQQLKAA